MSSWGKYKLGEIGTIKTGKTPPAKCQNSFNEFTGIPFVTPKDMVGNKWISDTERYLTQVGFNEVSNYLVNENSISVSCIGSDMGKAVLLKNKSVTNQQINTLTVNEEHNYEYVYYVLSRMQCFFKSIAGGSATPILNKSDFSNIEIFLPDLDRQNKVVEYLKYLDEKIQLNTQINQTLEQIAQTIFKSWFIDFDPVHAKANALANGQTLEQATQAAMAVISGKNTQELHRLQTANPEQYQQLWEIAEAFPSGFDEDGVPRGWGYEKSENLFDVGIGKTPPRKEPEWFSENSNDIEWISIKDMGNSEVFVNKSSEYLLESAVNKFNVKRIPENTVILSFKLTVGRVGITTKETTTNEAIAHFRLCEKSYLTTEFLYLYLKNFDFNNLGSTSSIATAVNSKTIKEMEILYPTLEIINVFQYRVSDIFKTIRSNSEQSNCLEKIRDELLPKLLSGELNGLPEKTI
ncbi:restriction endonuclease subunit S [Actinobacillus minor]|uniref:restriction endonuclease subunit S n=1 Tax=Actinobacillus minor TaxID=51047 RepID=UPI0026EDC9EF|nr:restriction endonuclease subunit S [Actinobacillus minor]